MRVYLSWWRRWIDDEGAGVGLMMRERLVMRLFRWIENKGVEVLGRWGGDLVGGWMRVLDGNKDDCDGWGIHTDAVYAIEK
jgi:hypothetical protein